MKIRASVLAVVLVASVVVASASPWTRRDSCGRTLSSAEASRLFGGQIQGRFCDTNTFCTATMKCAQKTTAFGCSHWYEEKEVPRANTKDCTGVDATKTCTATKYDPPDQDPTGNDEDKIVDGYACCLTYDDCKWDGIMMLCKTVGAPLPVYKAPQTCQ